MSQNKYARHLLKRFRIEGATLVGSPMEVGLKLSKFNDEKKCYSTIYRSLIVNLTCLPATR